MKSVAVGDSVELIIGNHLISVKVTRVTDDCVLVNTIVGKKKVKWNNDESAWEIIKNKKNK